MAQPSTLRRFEVEVSDVDRSVYASLDVRVAQHPSEAADRVVVRVLARALSHEDGLTFGRGVSTAEDSALMVVDETGRPSLSIEVGAPSADRLHRVSKASGRLQVYTHKPKSTLIREWSARKSIHRADDLEVVEVPTDVVVSLAETLERSQSWVVMRMDGELTVHVEHADLRCSGAVTRSVLAAFLRSA